LKKTCLALVLVALLFTAGCATPQTERQPWQFDMTSGMGGLDGSPDLQEYSYKFSLVNIEKRDLENVCVLLKINSNFSGRILSQNGPISKKITVFKPNDFITLEGKIQIDTKDLTKKQITDMGQVIESCMITWTDNGKVYNTTKAFGSSSQK